MEHSLSEEFTTIEQIVLRADGIVIEFMSMQTYSMLLFDEALNWIPKADKTICHQFLFDALTSAFCSFLGNINAHSQFLHVCRRDKDTKMYLVTLGMDSWMGDLNRDLYNINFYITAEGTVINKKQVAGMLCYRDFEPSVILWKCEVILEGTSEKTWFYFTTEKQVAWAIMIVFAYRDKAELRIEVDEKTGEILDVFMFSPIEGISM